MTFLFSMLIYKACSTCNQIARNNLFSWQYVWKKVIQMIGSLSQDKNWDLVGPPGAKVHFFRNLYSFSALKYHFWKYHFLKKVLSKEEIEAFSAFNESLENLCIFNFSNYVEIKHITFSKRNLYAALWSAYPINM